MIYTVITGNYDCLEQPEVLDSSYDYVCFTDRDGREGVWQLKKIPFDSPDPVIRSRYPKLQPHAVLPEYEYSVYMDANLCITGQEFYQKAEAAFREGALFAGVEHPQRDCVYEELRQCYLKGKVGTGAAWKHLKYLKSQEMPHHAGLLENNILLRAHNRTLVTALDNAWWQLFQACCTRDQLSLAPIFFSRHFSPSLLLGPGLNARNVGYIRYSQHPRSGKENIPGRLNWTNFKYNVCLLWRKMVLLCLK